MSKSKSKFKIDLEEYFGNSYGYGSDSKFSGGFICEFAIKFSELKEICKKNGLLDELNIMIKETDYEGCEDSDYLESYINLLWERGDNEPEFLCEGWLELFTEEVDRRCEEWENELKRLGLWYVETEEEGR